MSVRAANPCATPGGMNESALGRRSEVVHVGRAFGRAPDAEIVQHDARLARGDVPVVGLVQVVVEPDDRTRGPRHDVRLDHLARIGNPCAPVRLEERASIVAVRGELDEHGSGDRHRLLQVGARMVAEHQTGGLRALATANDFDLAAEQRIVDVVHADDAAAFEQHRVLDLGVAQLAAVADRRVRADVRVDQASRRHR